MRAELIERLKPSSPSRALTNLIVIPSMQHSNIAEIAVVRHPCKNPGGNPIKEILP